MRIDLQDQVALIFGSENALTGALAGALETNGARVLTKTGDAEAGEAAVAEALDRFGRLDMLIAIPSPLSARGNKGDHDPSAVVEPVCRAAEAALSASRGRILILTSALGLVAARAEPIRSASDAALLSTVRSLAMRLGPAGLRINALSLGVIAAGEGVDSEFICGDPRRLSHAPTGRAGTLADVVGAALFLLDPDNSYMTGHALVVDGGWTAGFARDF